MHSDTTAKAAQQRRKARFQSEGLRLLQTLSQLRRLSQGDVDLSESCYTSNRNQVLTSLNHTTQIRSFIHPVRPTQKESM
jgi:hypothetical protein